MSKSLEKSNTDGAFNCWQCDENLTGNKYVMRDDHGYCLKCYDSVFANMCVECNKSIGIDSKDLAYKDKHWHEECFACTKCASSLVNKPFGSKLERIYCANCFDESFASKCDGCNNAFKAGTKKMEYKGKIWHEDCFSCDTCKKPIGSASFVPKNKEIFCSACYEDKFATKCIKCSSIIQTGGVTYRGETWHKECFTCSQCATSLAGVRFTTKEDKPLCQECFATSFAKKCATCTKPITGASGTKFITFEDRNWHGDCFTCTGCQQPLAGKGFITDGPVDVLCPDCAKAKILS